MNKQNFFKGRSPNDQTTAHEEMLNIPAHKKMEIKTLKFHLTTAKMAITKNTNDKWW
jgi:hypothetical protein